MINNNIEIYKKQYGINIETIKLKEKLYLLMHFRNIALNSNSNNQKNE